MDSFKIRPQPLSFFIKHYVWAAAAALLLIPGGLLVLMQTQVLEFALAAWAVAVILLSAALIHTHLHQRAYLTLAGEELIYEFGILDHHRVAAPINKITDVGLDASWFERLIGACTLKVNTAGGTGYEILAEDFPRREVDVLYAELMRLMRKTPGSLPDELAKK
ncbi:Bacterial PH domain protein [uncultured archaeon]|nr:Bacterial PH domain protein [uncultured archaeon]